MDLFEQGQLDPTKNGKQIHDFSPGIPPSGLFWTQPVPRDAVETDLDEGTASFEVRNLAELDAHNLEGAVTGGPAEPATVSFEMKWSAVGPALQGFRDEVHRFGGDFIFSKVAMEWSARVDGFRFVSDSDSVTTVAAVIGREKNGVFFP